MITKEKTITNCWICGVKLPSMKVRAALKLDPTFLDGHEHLGSISRFDNNSHCCDECGQVEAVGVLLAPLSPVWRGWVREAMLNAQQTEDRELWQAAVCMARGAMIGHHENDLELFDRMMEKFE